MISRIVVAAATLLFAISVSAFTPRTGHWYNPDEDGTGYNIDIQDGAIVVTVYSYKANGDAQWYIATGTMVNGQKSFTGTLNRVKNGACMSCPYVKPITDGNDGTITITFSTEVSATVTKPGGLVSNIKPLNFGFGEPPTGLLGQWVYVEFIGNSHFADHYTFTTIGPATTTGNGVVADLVNYAGCELQVSGTLAGLVVCAHWTDATFAVVADQYVYQLGLDQTFSGIWISPTTATSYAMKGFMWASRSGFAKALEQEINNPSQGDQKRQAELSLANETPKSSGLTVDATAMHLLREEMRRAMLGLR